MIQIKRFLISLIFSLIFILSLKTISYGVSNVIEIKTPEEMWKFAESVNNGNTYAGKTVKLKNSINLNCSESKPWMPIGSINQSYFSGIFDGQGFSISNIYINNKTGKYNDGYYGNVTGCGLFGIIINGSVKNLNIRASKIVLSNYDGDIGLIAGSLLTKNNKTASINNCIVYNSSIKVTQTTDEVNNIGGIVGKIYDKKSGIYNCIMNASNSINYSNSKNETTSIIENIGGIVGQAEGEISRCYNYQKVITYGNSMYIGGIAGSALNTCKYCINKGEITNTHLTNNMGSSIGGISGESKKLLYAINLGKIIIKENKANPSNGSFNYIGGITGEGLYIQYAYNRANIQISSSLYSGVGGIAGSKLTTNNLEDSIILYNCYNTGSIPKGGHKESGALIGMGAGKTIVSKCYFTNSMYGISRYQEGDKFYYCPDSYFHKYSSNKFKDKGTKINSSELKNKNFISKINGSQQIFQIDKYNENGGAPIILWQKGISVNKMPTKVEYKMQKENLNLSGGKINIIYNYSSFNTVYSMQDHRVAVTGFNNKIAGNNRLQFKNGEFVNFFNVKIIDIIKPKATVKYSITKKTNKNVVVTITADEEIQGVSGWILSKDKKVLTKTYKVNGIEKIPIKDLAGNEISKQIKVANIDKVAPKVTVKYSTTKLINGNVKVTITANEEIKHLNGWTLSKDGKILTKTYTKNSKETKTIYDEVGNKTAVTIKIDNIDKTVPKATIKYSKTTTTNDDVKVTITANEQMQVVNGWILSKDRKVLTKTYKVNTTEKITLKDLAGNSISKQIKVVNIDKVAPKATVKYSTTSPTKGNVKVTITSNESVKQIKGWTLSKDGKILTKTYTKNIKESVTICDIAGNNSTANIKIDNIEKTELEIDIQYSKTELTNENVKVTIIANKEIQKQEGWEISENQTSISKEYNKNTTEIIIIKDQVGNEKEAKIEIENIDKEAPKLTVSESTKETTKEGVIITISANEIIQEKEGWTLSEDRKSLIKEYLKNTEEKVEIYDLAGNRAVTKVKVANINTEESKIDEDAENTGDVNQNDQIDIGDILLLLRHIAQNNNNTIYKESPDWKLSEEKIKIGDVNKNNKIDIGDILKMQRYIAAINSKEIAENHSDWLNL